MGAKLSGMLSGVAWATGETLPWSHLWFLPALFVALLATHALALGVNKSAGWAAAAVLAVGAAAVLPMADYIGWPWSVDLLPLCLAFVWTGQALRTSSAARRAVTHPATIVIAAAAFVLSLGAAEVDLNLRVFEPFAPAIGAALAGCALTLAVSHGLCRFAAIARPNAACMVAARQQHFCNCASKFARLAWRHEPALPQVGDFWNSAHVARHEWQRARSRFEEHVWHTLRAAGQHEQIG